MTMRRSGPAQEYAHNCIEQQAYHRKAFLSESLAYWVFVWPVCGLQKASELHAQDFIFTATHKKEETPCCQIFCFFLLFFNYLCAVIYFDIVEFFLYTYIKIVGV